MDSIFIKGGRKMAGSLKITTAKNSLLPILAGSIMCNGYVEIRKCTKYTDVETMLEILKDLGCKTKDFGEDTFIDAKDANNYFIREEYSRKVRSSIFMLGSLLTRFKRAKVAYPGGCNIGARPIDLHIDAPDVWCFFNIKSAVKWGF